MRLFGFLKGKDGKNGKDAKPCTPCKDGYTPVKGVDYFDGKDGLIGGFGYKTVLDYGAKLYLTKEAAIAGESFHEAGQKMLDETGTCLLPPYGWMKLDDSIILWSDYDSVKSLGQGNKGLNIVADKPISMFIPICGWQVITGFTAWYVGNKITEECAVVKIGDKRNNGGYFFHQFQETNVKNWPNRTRINQSVFDFDFVGHAKYYLSRTNLKVKNPDFIKNYGAHPVWVNYDTDYEDAYSHCHGTKIKGNWIGVNTGIKISRRVETQALNTFDIDVSIWGAKQFCSIKDINFSKIKILGQEVRMLNYNANDPEYATSNKDDWEENIVPLFEVIGENIWSDIFVYDVDTYSGKHKVKGQYHVKKLDLQGSANILAYGGENQYYLNTDLNDSLLVNHSYKIGK